MTLNTNLPDPYRGEYQHAALIAPSDVADLPGPGISEGIYVGGAGDVAVDTAGGENSVVFSAVPAGTILRIRATRVRTTGTTATLMMQIW